jgi:nitrate/TMAO reductase-like tetraheme cytochrome c subunit
VNEYIDAILNADFSTIWQLIVSVVNNPLADVQASLLVLVAFVVLTLLAIVIAILVLGFGGDEDEGEEGVEAEPVVERPKVGAVRPPKPVLSPADRRFRIALNLVWVFVAIAVFWIVAGITTGSDTMCLSCHEQDMPHAERLAEESEDPHLKTACVSCHETGGAFAAVTFAVPARVTHFAQGIAGAEKVRGYGSPVASAACARCHESELRETLEVEARGVRVSHVEPLEAGATCLDCHEIQSTTGSVGNWTVGMAPCLRCHDNEQASAECESCHTKDIAYAVHVNIEPQPRDLVPNPQCGTCHDETRCDACHGIRMPHTDDFVRGGHAREATLDIWKNAGRTCKRCHTETRNSCTSCHRTMGPGHPVTDWPKVHGLGGPQAGFGSCDGCHGYLATHPNRNFCGVCHPEYQGYQLRR